jgi:acetyl/propionyl-CoA carboxylase alpha subunit
MRVVRTGADAADLISSARREAQAAFGDGTLYVERLIERPRHVEMQVFGDTHGNVVHLFERECSLQRRHQKIIEESPSPALTAPLRQRMADAATAAARAAGYCNAGTIEFLLDGEGDDARFYFLEMNTRLQVEHPVTEAVTGCDLVRAQFAVAAGAPLPWTQDAIGQRGHAIECRIYAEAPESEFLPQAGPLALYREPSGPGIRVDSGVTEGDDIGVNYDPLIAKVIVYAETRSAALTRACAALENFPILGIRTNLPFLLRLLRDPRVQAAAVDTGFVDRHQDEFVARTPPPPEAVAVAATVPTFAAAARRAATEPSAAEAATAFDPWLTLRGWGR